MTHTPHPVTRSDFARRAGRGRSRITESAAPGGALERACLPGGLLDAAHPVVMAWCAKRRIDPSRLLDHPAAVSSPASVEELLTDAAEGFGARVCAALSTGEIEPRALVLALDLVTRLLTETRRKVAAGLAVPVAVAGGSRRPEQLEPSPEASSDGCPSPAARADGASPAAAPDQLSHGADTVALQTE
jgi:hypothetical protein